MSTTSSQQQQTQYGFFFDQSRCTACMACTVACKSWNKLSPGPTKWLRIFEWETGTFPNPEINTLYAPCYHCQNPVCVTAANGAMLKEPTYGAVLIDSTQANSPSLRAAAAACPYGSIVFDSDAPNATASKCTMCIDRLEQGLKPVCVLSCPMRALDFGPLNQMTQYGTNSQLNGMPDPSITKPSVVFKQKDTRKQIVTLSSDRVLSLMGNRGGSLPAVYNDPSTVTTINQGQVGRSQLNIKSNSNADLMNFTSNDDA